MTLPQTLNKSEMAYAWIKERINHRDFTPGYRLVLGVIAAELGMSVVPVREAVRLLEAEGLIEFERNVGARVISIDATEYAHTMQTLGVIEGSATALAATRLSGADLDRAAAINAEMRTLLTAFDPHTFTVLNQRFHTVLFEYCPNPHLLEMVEREWKRMAGLRDSTFAFVPERAQVSVQEHEELLEVIRAGADLLEIELLARHHRWRTMDAYLHPQPRHGGTP